MLYSIDADKDLLEEIRRIVKALRTPSIKLLLHEQKLKEAILDVDTRWNTIFYMVIYCILYKFIPILIQNLYFSD